MEGMPQCIGPQAASASDTRQMQWKHSHSEALAQALSRMHDSVCEMPGAVPWSDGLVGALCQSINRSCNMLWVVLDIFVGKEQG